MELRGPGHVIGMTFIEVEVEIGEIVVEHLDVVRDILAKLQIAHLKVLLKAHRKHVPQCHRALFVAKQDQREQLRWSHTLVAHHLLW